MPAKITALPGKRCELYVAGCCLFLERQNPGLRQEWRCKVLVAWENEYDKFLTQADNFNLDMRTSVRIWRQRMATLLASQPACPNYRPGLSEEDFCAQCAQTPPKDAEGLSLYSALDEDKENEVACVYSWVGLCLQALPVCEGICHLYEEKL